MRSSFSNHEIVTLAVYLLGGESKAIDTEDVAVRANEIAPGRFTWRKYPEQIDIEIVRVCLSNAKKPQNGKYLIGTGKDGWLLTERGYDFALRRDGLPISTLVAAPGNIWGLGPLFRRRGGEPGDFLVVILDLSRREAVIRIGDAGLPESFQKFDETSHAS